MTSRNPLVQVRNLSVEFEAQGRGRTGTVRAVQDVSFDIHPGEVVGLVGESGSGKTTTGRAILNLVPLTSGSIRFDGQEIAGLNADEMRPVRRRMQIIFQDPFSSLNPRMTVGQIVDEALLVAGAADREARERERSALLERVGLSKDHASRHVHEFSGGQRQRIGIARALAVRPDLIIADEPVSALDVSVQAQIINLLKDLREEFNLALLFIAHDLAVVEAISDRVLVMYLGRIMEEGSTSDLYHSPAHPYTEALLSAIPVPKPGVSGNRIVLEGDLPSPVSPPSGCVFRTRCPIAIDRCAAAVPSLEPEGARHRAACIRRSP